MSKLTDKVFELAQPYAEELGVELLEVKYVHEDKRWFLRLIIDKRGGISMDDCENLSRAIDPVLDEEVDISQAYYLEVQSPGLDRPLKTQADFLRYRDQEVELSFYQKFDGQKKWSGNLVNHTEDSITLEIAEEEKSFSLEEIANIKRVIRF